MTYWTLILIFCMSDTTVCDVVEVGTFPTYVDCRLNAAAQLGAAERRYVKAWTEGTWTLPRTRIEAGCLGGREPRAPE